MLFILLLLLVDDGLIEARLDDINQPLRRGRCFDWSM